MVHFERQTRISSKAALTAQPFNETLKGFFEGRAEREEKNMRELSPTFDTTTTFVMVGW
jgi:hypothetical protein